MNIAEGPENRGETPLSGDGNGAVKPPYRLLIVDDEDDLRFLIRAILGDLGWEADEAADGHEALAKLTTQKYDLVLLDHRMPGMDGAEVYDKLRAVGILVPVILITAATQVAEIAMAHGISKFLGKPFGIDDLVRVVEDLPP